MQQQLGLVGAQVDTLLDIMAYWTPTSDPSQLDSCSLFRCLARSFGSSISVYGATSKDAWPLWASTAQPVVQLDRQPQVTCGKIGANQSALKLVVWRALWPGSALFFFAMGRYARPRCLTTFAVARDAAAAGSRRGSDSYATRLYGQLVSNLQPHSCRMTAALFFDSVFWRCVTMGSESVV